MKHRIKLKDDEWNYILKALQFFEDKNLKPAIQILKKAKYEPYSFLFVGEEFFKEYIKEQIKELNNQIEEIECIYDEIIKGMEEN